MGRESLEQELERLRRLNWFMDAGRGGAGGGSGESGPMPAPPTTTYEGLVATRARLANFNSTSNVWANARSGHVATDAITSLRLVFGNFRVANATEDGHGGSTQTTVTASVEYPAGTFTQARFGGNVSATMEAVPTTGAVATGGLVFSDPISVAIPLGATFWVRQFINAPVGLFWVSNARDAALDLLQLSAASGQTDKTMGGTVAHNGGTGYMAPIAILGQTAKASVILCGDSIMRGFAGTFTTDARDGIVAPSIPAAIPFLNLAGDGTKANDFLAKCVNRTALFPYCSHMACNLGVNDVISAAQTQADLSSIAAAFPARVKKVNVTIGPRASSTDAFVTEANQTPHGGNVTYRAVSNAIRAGSVAGYTAYAEVTRGVLEGTLDSGKWYAPGVAHTGDGLHPNPTGYARVVSTGAVPPSLWT